MLHAAAEGLRRVARLPGLVALLLLVNIGSAALLALPLVRVLESDLEHKDAARAMTTGFDFPWWSHWSDGQQGWTASFAPDVFGAGVVFKNIDLLLRGYLPAGLFVSRRAERAAAASADAPPGLDPVILALGAAYLVVQTFLAGGLLATLRAARGGWTLRGLVHGSGFYFGRFLRLTVLVLLVHALLFGLNAPLARFADHRAREAVSETTAHVWLLGRHALLLLAVLWVNMVSGYAKATLVLEERSSAALALLSAFSFAFRRPLRTFGHYLLLAAVGVALLALWRVLDGAFTPSGYGTQLLAFVLAQAWMAGRLALRLILWAGQIVLYDDLSRAPADAAAAA